MALIDDVKQVCDRLAPLGWRDLLLGVTNNRLDIRQETTARLRAQLAGSLTRINRNEPGFEDFHPQGGAGIVPGRPERSLLYHAFASPHVHPAPGASSDAYPTLHDLDTLENYVYSLVSDRADLDDAVVAVFAYQYREANRTTHLRHADHVYSRTGVARVGTTAQNYDPSRRSFWVNPSDGSNGLAVLPARYAVFLARIRKPGPAGSVQGGHRGAADSDYVFPLHKLFPGTECLTGRNLSVDFAEFHRNEKLAKSHSLTLSAGGLPVPEGFDISQAPYVRDSRNGDAMVNLERVGSSVLVVPTASPRLVRVPTQRNSITQRDELVHFVVPRVRVVRGRETRFARSSLEIPAFNEDRLSPEYVNIRHEIDPNGPVTQVPRDLNDLNASEFSRKLEDGGYPAAHFIDDSCDGCVEAVVRGLDPAINRNLLAFSLVTAPDFFPLADQLAMEADPTIERVAPLSKGRLPVNPTLPRPSNPNTLAFRRDDETVTAVVGGLATGPILNGTVRENRSVSYLPDCASNVFAPGWDTSRSRDAVGPFLTSSGLGSPFPEDAKLCAALASFWPAVAPDNGRTFGNRGFGNQLPMLDEELGFHPNHPRVRSGEVSSFRGWDGEFGPFFEQVNNRLHVNFVDIARSDYVSNALAGEIRVHLTSDVQAEDLIRRHQALNACEAVIGIGGLCLVTVRRIDDWLTSGRGVPQLLGSGFLLEFAELTGTPSATNDLRRVRQEVRKIHLCQFGENGIAYKNGSAQFAFRPN